MFPTFVPIWRHVFRLLRLAAAASIVLGIVTLAGCREQRQVTDDPEAIEKARQEHIKTTQRELQDINSGQ